MGFTKTFFVGRDISQAPLFTSSTRENLNSWVFNSWIVGLFRQIVCLCICLYIPLFLKENFYLETLQGPLKGIILVVKMHKIAFKPVTLPKGSVLGYFLPVFEYRYYMFLYLSRTIQFLPINFLHMLLGYPSLNKTFSQHLPLR